MCMYVQFEYLETSSKSHELISRCLMMFAYVLHLKITAVMFAPGSIQKPRTQVVAVCARAWCLEVQRSRPKTVTTVMFSLQRTCVGWMVELNVPTNLKIA